MTEIILHFSDFIAFSHIKGGGGCPHLIRVGSRLTLERKRGQLALYQRVGK